MQKSVKIKKQLIETNKTIIKNENWKIKKYTVDEEITKIMTKQNKKRKNTTKNDQTEKKQVKMKKQRGKNKYRNKKKWI